MARQAIWFDSCPGERTHFLPCRYLLAFIHPFPAVRCRGTKVGAHGTPGGRPRPRQSCVAVSRSCNARVCPAPPASAVRRHGWLKCAPALASSQGPAISARPASAESPHRLSSTPTQSHPETPPRAPLLSPCAAPYCARVRLAALGMSRIGTGSGLHARGASGAGSACAAVRDASIGPASPVRAVATAAEGKLTQNREGDASDSPWCNVMRARSPDRIALACERSAALYKCLISECANGQSGVQGPPPEEED